MELHECHEKHELTVNEMRMAVIEIACIIAGYGDAVDTVIGQMLVGPLIQASIAVADALYRVNPQNYAKLVKDIAEPELVEYVKHLLGNALVAE